MQRLNTYRITAYLKITIDIEARDDDEAIDDAQAKPLSDWTHGKLEVYEVENLGAVQNEQD